MNKTQDKPIPVLFRKWAGDVIALFPTLPAEYTGSCCDSYMHVGQHGAAEPEGIIAHSRPAMRAEYAALKHELESAPYFYRLRVVQHRSAAMKAEFKANQKRSRE